MGVLTCVGTGVAAYITSMAALSPCPLLVHHTWGAVLIVSLTLCQAACTLLPYVTARSGANRSPGDVGVGAAPQV